VFLGDQIPRSMESFLARVSRQQPVMLSRWLLQERALLAEELADLETAVLEQQ